MEFISRDPAQVNQLFRDGFDFPALENVPFDLWYVSAMRNFQFDEDFLDEISDKLEDELKLIKVNLKQVNAKITIIRQPPTLPVVEVSVFGNKKNFLFNAYLMSVRTVQPAQTVSLPLLCVFVDKIEKVTKTVTAFLGKSFGCLIEPFHVNDLHLRALMAIATHETLRRQNNDGITISLKVMADGMKMALLHLTLEAEGLMALWDLEPDENTISDKDITNFLGRFFDHFDVVYDFKLSNCSLERFVLDGVNISFEKKLKIKSNDMDVLIILLKYLLELSERMKLYKPSKPISTAKDHFWIMKKKRRAKPSYSDDEI